MSGLLIIGQTRAIAMVDRKHLLAKAVRNAVRLLPPHVVGAPFAYQNPLRAFEDLDFGTAAIDAARLYGAEPFLSSEAYQEALKAGQFLPDDIESVLAQEPNVWICPAKFDRIRLRRAMVAHLPRRFDLATIEWILNETDLLLRFRKDAAIQTRSELAVKGARVEATEVKTLFEAVLKRVSELPTDIPLYVRPRDGMLAATGVDLDEIVLPFMGRLLRSFTGLGQKWPLAGGQRGFLAATQANFAGKGAEAFPETLKSLARIWGAPPQERTNWSCPRI
jgi:hypothetical protein